MAYYALIMAGGVGTRLWPLSRRDRPKQSLELIGERTMFEHAVDRIGAVDQHEALRRVDERAGSEGAFRERVADTEDERSHDGSPFNGLLRRVRCA